MITTESSITEKIWGIVNQHTGIPFCEIDKDTDIADNRSIIIQDVGIILRIPIYGMKDISTAGQLADAAISQIAGNRRSA